MKKVLIGLSLIASLCSAQAANWVKHGEYPTGIALYDPSTIAQYYNNGIVKTVWSKHIDNNGTYILFLNEYHCDSNMYRNTAIHLYYTNGPLIESGRNPNEPWSYLPPDSVGMSLQNIVCKKSKQR